MNTRKTLLCQSGRARERRPAVYKATGAASRSCIRYTHTLHTHAHVCVAVVALALPHWCAGMEFNHSPTCNMSDWYERKWYECANQTDALVFGLAGGAAPVVYKPTFTCAVVVLRCHCWWATTPSPRATSDAAPSTPSLLPAPLQRLLRYRLRQPQPPLQSRS